MAVGLVLLVPHVLQAQPVPRPARIGGVVYDSTSNVPLAKATVDAVVASDPARIWSTTTDERGTFAFDSLPAATYIVAVSHPRLDSLGVRQLSLGSTVSAGERARVRLTVPSAPSLIRRVCGDSLAADRSGYVRGVLRNAERGALAVPGALQVRWAELSVTRETMERQVVALQARADDEGRFTVCGVPVGGVLQVRAWSGTDSTGVLDLSVPANGILLRDLAVGHARTSTMLVRDSAVLTPTARDSLADTTAYEAQVKRGRASMRGTTRRRDGAAVPDALVSVWGTGLEQRAANDGSFALADLPTGSYTAEVRAVGFQPVRTIIDVWPGDTTRLDVTLDKLVQLETVRVVSRAPNRGLQAFENNRRTRASGRFITPEMLDERPPIRTADVFRTIPGVRIVPGLFGDRIIMRAPSLSSWCTPDLWIDGMRVVNDVPLDMLVSAQDLLAAEVYASGPRAPAELTGMSGCGAIVLYTGDRKAAKR